jgi:uncharacterized protein (TIGR02246 family)
MNGRTLSLVAAVLLLANSCEGRVSGDHRPRSAREAVGAVYKTVEEAFLKGDLDAIAQAYAEDAQWYVPESPVLEGRSAIRQAWKANAGSGGNRLRFEVAEIEQRGDRAHEVGRFTISGPDGAVLAAGKQIVVWARQPGGEWKTLRSIFNWDISPRQP